MALRGNARLRDELLDGEIFYTLREAQIVIESWAALQHHQAAPIARIQAASTGGICPCLRRVASCATPTGSAGHAAKAGTNTSGAGGLYPSDACGLTVL